MDITASQQVSKQPNPTAQNSLTPSQPCNTICATILLAEYGAVILE